MGFGNLLSGIPSLKKLQGENNDDGIDRLSHVYTVAFNIVFAIIISTSSYVGRPIHCWPLHDDFKSDSYVEDLCWVKNTYNVYENERTHEVLDNREDREVTYYQWIPLILTLQAFMYKFPNLMWRLLNGGSGISLDKIVRMTDATQFGTVHERDTCVNNIALYMDRWLTRSQKFYRRMSSARRMIDRVMCCCNKRQGTFLTHYYLFIKVLYVINAVAWFFIMNAFLSIDYGLYGIQVLKYMNDDEGWARRTRFPLVTMCEFYIRMVGSEKPKGRQYIAQCTLPINFFNEKMFIVLWFWMAFVATLTCISLVWWVYYLLTWLSQYRSIRSYLRFNNIYQDTKEYKAAANAFTNDYLRHDGVFIIHIIGKNSTELIAADLVAKLWQLHCDREKATLEPSPSIRSSGSTACTDLDHVSHASGGGSVRKRSYEYNDNDAFDMSDVNGPYMHFPYSISTTAA